MNRKIITSTAAVTTAAILSSCTAQQMQQFGTAATGVGVGLLAGNLVGGSSAQRAIVGIAAAMITVAIIQHYQASQEQKRYAQSRAYAAARSSSFQQVKAKKKVRYVAVPVKKKSATEKSGLMLYDTDKGDFASDQVYVPKASSIKGNSIVNVNGKKALLESGFDG